MKKYLVIFSLAWQNEFVYRLNFIFWRLRNVFRFLMAYFLWQGVFVGSRNVFGYSKSQILTYVFTVLIVSAIVQSAPSADNIGSEIGSGDLSNYLVKPIGYLKYWFTRDLASKLLNILFAFGELLILSTILHPTWQLPSSLMNIAGFLISCTFAVLIYFFLSDSARFVAFWTPENTWGISFVLIILIETLAGGVFPLDILPGWAKVILQLTPFPYLLYFPAAIFLGKITGLVMVRVLGQSLVFVFVTYFLATRIFSKGLKSYSSEGR